jgi:hypothetical protein
VRQTYSFKPHELDDDQQTAHAAELDRFWDLVSKHPDRYLPQLRAELEADRQLPFPFFYFDGGQLLMKLSPAADDRRRVLGALARADLLDIEPISYVRTVSGLARDGLDTSAAALRILDDPQFNPRVVEHALELGRGDSLIFMLLPSNNPAIAPAVLAEFPKRRDEGARKALLLMTYHLATPEGDGLLRRVAADTSEAPAVRASAQGLCRAMTDAARGAAADAASPDAARALQRNAARRISDEALSEIDAATRRLRAVLAARAKS